jgi:hypothetical protein
MNKAHPEKASKRPHGTNTPPTRDVCWLAATSIGSDAELGRSTRSSSPMEMWRHRISPPAIRPQFGESLAPTANKGPTLSTHWAAGERGRGSTADTWLAVTRTGDSAVPDAPAASLATIAVLRGKSSTRGSSANRAAKAKAEARTRQSPFGEWIRCCPRSRPRSSLRVTSPTNSPVLLPWEILTVRRKGASG